MKVKLDEGEWDLGDLLGSGAYGTVYEARSGDGSLAAVKLTPKKSGLDREHHFINMTGVRNVVPVIASGEHENQWVTVMPRAVQSLEQHLAKSGALPQKEALRVLADVAECLTDLAGKAVIHRDIKPANVLLLDGRWCLADFGIARDLGVATATFTFRGGGTQPYLAPEAWHYEPPTHAIDIYSFGVMAYELTEGKRPYNGPAPHNYREQHLGGKFPPFRQAPTQLAGLIAECLLTAPLDRPSASEVLTRLTRMSSGLTYGLPTQHARSSQGGAIGHQQGERPSAQATSHPGDAIKAARLLRLLPLDGYWLRWLENTPTMFKVPLTVSDPVCDAHPQLKTDRPRYVDPELQDAHHRLVETLGTLCDQLNGMTDISDEGQDVLEISHPGTSADRNELNRAARRARDGFIASYDSMINLLNAKGLLPSPPTDPVDITVELQGARWVHGGAVTGPFAAVASMPNADPTAPYYFVVEAASRNEQGPQIAAVGIELIRPNGDMATYLFPPRGPRNAPQLPFQLTSHGAGQALANAAEIVHAIRLLGGAAITVRPFAKTGNGKVFRGVETPVTDMRPFLDVVLPPAAE
ncbi:serine/threonine-protein kinase [Streptomyces sp. NPDC012438]|uniref:serine/threonine-protein kinase n=1 Tax=Streptomyces sp. NPDC012438 TaxID=3364833 RepID=UPI0036ED1BB3